MIDALGLPVTNRGDGGDSCAEAGTLLALDPSRFNFPMRKYFPVTGPVRHPDTDKWYGRPGRFSRDQLVAVLCGFAIDWRYQDEKEDLYLMHKKRNFLSAWNYKRNFVYDTLDEHKQKSTPDVPWNFESKQPDFCGPKVWSLWFRVWYRRDAWPLLCLLDLELLGSAILWCFRKDGISRNYLLGLYVATSVIPTPTAWLARLITPIDEVIERWQKHCIATGAIDTSDLFRKAFKR